MKQPKKLTRNQKELLKKEGLDPHEWMFHGEDRDALVFVRKDNHEEVHTVWK